MKQIDVGIVGAGMSGLLAALRLNERDGHKVTVYEKADGVGGTWRHNHYPGLSCDVPAHAYTYSFQRNPGWSNRYASGAEIRSYFEDVAGRHGLERRIRTNTEIIRAAHDGGSWVLTGRDGTQYLHDVVITACGVLHHPRYPDIPGLDSFSGPCFHTGRWDHSVSLEGKTIGIVGTSSTGVQVVSALSRQNCSLKVFQRTPQWIFPIPNRTYRGWEKSLMRRVPLLNEIVAGYYERSLENILGNSVIRDGWQRRLVNRLVRWNLNRVKDPELRAKLTPEDLPLCRRIVMSGDYYDALQRRNVALVTDGIREVVPEGIVDVDGGLHRLDVLVLATGYKSLEYMRPMEVTGDTGRSLADYWDNGPKAYLSVMIPGLANFFMLSGPHCPYGNFSAIRQTEIEVDYILKCVDLLAQDKLKRIEVSDAATDRFNQWVRDTAPRTIWMTGCKSWYLSEQGIPMNWPGTPNEFRAALKEPEMADFVT